MPDTHFPVFFRNHSQEQLLRYFQSQFPEHPSSCGPFAIAMAANLYNGLFQYADYQGANVESVLERRWIKIPGLGMPAWLGYARALRQFVLGRVEHKSNACIKDLELAVSDNTLPVVAVSWQTTLEILRDIPHATVGHYMVVVGYDTPNERIYFLNPALLSKEGASQLFSMSYQELEEVWIGTSNIFIPPGSIWIISR